MQAMQRKPAVRWWQGSALLASSHELMTRVWAAVQCKHQLAARLADILHSCNTVCVPDEVFAQLLIAT